MQVGGVHQQEQGHQNHFEIQDVIGVTLWKTSQILAGKTLQPDDVSPDPKSGHGHNDQQCQDFERCYQDIVRRSQKGKNPVGPEKTVDDNFQQFDIDDNKTDVNNDVEQSGNGSFDHFGLSKSNHGHVFPTQFRIVFAIYVRAKIDVSDDFFYVQIKITKSCNQENCK